MPVDDAPRFRSPDSPEELCWEGKLCLKSRLSESEANCNYCYKIHTLAGGGTSYLVRCASLMAHAGPPPTEAFLPLTKPTGTVRRGFV